jgi:hypothetical protein
MARKKSCVNRRQHELERPMKFSPMHALLIIAMACPAFAQTSPPASSPQSPPAASPPEANPPPNEAMANQTPTEAAQKDPHNIQSSGPEDWAMVKGHDKGFLTKEDALPNSWLAQNFSSCDKDQDGKISQAEYDSCVKRR